MKRVSESQEQKKLVMKLRWLHPDIEFFSIPNGGKRGKGEARNLVLEGVEKGVPDLFIVEPRGGFFGLFIEMKKKDVKDVKGVKGVSKGVVSPAQMSKHQKYIAKGYNVVVCYGCDHAMEIIDNYMSQYITQ